MPVRLRDLHHCLEKMPFLWGFDNGREDCLRLLPGRSTRNPFESWGACLLESLAVAGWDVPGVTVSISVGGSMGDGDPYRYVSQVSGEHQGMKWSVGFHGYVKATGQGRTRHFGAANSFRWGASEYTAEEDGSGKADDVSMLDRFEDVLMSAVARIEAMPPSPGHRRAGPDGDDNIRRFLRRDRIPAPPGFPKLYAWVDTSKRNSTKPGVALSAQGKRFVTNYRDEDRVLMHPRHYDGFEYAFPDMRNRLSEAYRYVDDECAPHEIRLRDLNEIYVVDLAAETRAYEKAAAASPEAREFSRDQQCDISTAAAKTMVAAADYQGGFENPMYLIGRTLFKDEARKVKGPVSVEVDDGALRVVVTDEVTGRRAVVSETAHIVVGRMNDAARLAREIGRRTGRSYSLPEGFEEEIARRRVAIRERMERERIERNEPPDPILDMLMSP